MIPPFDLLPPLLRGAALTAEIMVYSAALAFLISFVAGFARLSRYAVARGMAAAYVEVFRGTSLLVQLFWMFFVLPLFGLNLPPMVVAVLGLGLNLGSYGSEVVRSALLAVPKGQTEASVALNMTAAQRLRRIILPQAFVMMLPPFGNLLIELLKSTALVSLITLSDATFEAIKLRTTIPSREAEIFTMLLLVYFLMAYPLTLGVRKLEQRSAVGRR